MTPSEFAVIHLAQAVYQVYYDSLTEHDLLNGDKKAKQRALRDKAMGITRHDRVLLDDPRARR